MLVVALIVLGLSCLGLEMLLTRASHRRLVFLVAAAVAFTILVGRPIPVAEDDANYLLHFTEPDRFSSDLDSATGGLSTLVTEPLYVGLAYWLTLTFDAEVSLRIILAIGLVGAFFAIGRLCTYPTLALLLYLGNPFIFVNHYLHVREGLAIGLVMLGLALGSRVRVVPYSMAPFLHSAALLPLGALAWERLTERRLTQTLRLLGFVLGIAAAAFLLEVVLTSMAIPGRRAGYTFDFHARGSGAMVLICVALLSATMVLTGKRSLYAQLACYGFVCYAIFYFWTDFSFRLFQALVPFLPLAREITLDPRQGRAVIWTGVVILYTALLTVEPGHHLAEFVWLLR